MTQKTSIIISDNERIIDFISIEWCPEFDKIIGIYSQNKSNEETLAEIVRNVSLGDKCFSVTLTKIRKRIAAVAVYGIKGQIPETIDDAMNDYFENGSVGVHINMQDLDTITFFSISENGERVKNVVSIDELRKFYSEKLNHKLSFLEELPKS